MHKQLKTNFLSLMPNVYRKQLSLFGMGIYSSMVFELPHYHAALYVIRIIARINCKEVYHTIRYLHIIKNDERFLTVMVHN